MITMAQIQERSAKTGLGEVQAYYQLAAERRIREDLRRGWTPRGQRLRDFPAGE